MAGAQNARVLLLDIETAPSATWTWGLFNQNIAINQVEEPGYTLCWAAKWLGKNKMLFSSIHRDGRGEMLNQVHALLTEADIVIHFNGSNFDIPTLNSEFLQDEMAPPAPFAEVDLLKTCRSRFRFLSNKMDFVARLLGIEGKVPHKGMELWKDCMRGDEASWKTMEKYNKHDVVISEKIYHRLLPWIHSHPNMSLFIDDDEPRCINCGSDHLQSRGFARTPSLIYRRYQCKNCGKWSRGRLKEGDGPPSKVVGIK